MRRPAVQVPIEEEDFAKAEKRGARLYRIWGTDRWVPVRMTRGLPDKLLCAVAMSRGLSRASCSSTRVSSQRYLLCGVPGTPHEGCCTVEKQRRGVVAMSQGDVVLHFLQDGQEVGLRAGICTHVHPW